MSDPTNLNDLLAGTRVDDEAMASMAYTADTLGDQINAALGDNGLEQVQTSEVLVLTLDADDSTSIKQAWVPDGRGGHRIEDHSQLVRDGHNLIITALRGTTQSTSVLATCRLFNRGVLYPFTPLEGDGVLLLDGTNYQPGGSTPLYDDIAISLTAAAAKVTEIKSGGLAARGLTVIVTDGADVGSTSYRSPESLQAMVRGLLQTEQHIIMGMGIDDGKTDFMDLFTRMGIPREWILTPKNTESEIRAAFQTVSNSAVRVSQVAGGSFSQSVLQAGLGGFGGNP